MFLFRCYPEGCHVPDSEKRLAPLRFLTLETLVARCIPFRPTHEMFPSLTNLDLSKGQPVWDTLVCVLHNIHTLSALVVADMVYNTEQRVYVAPKRMLSQLTVKYGTGGNIIIPRLLKYVVAEPELLSLQCFKTWPGFWITRRRRRTRGKRD